MKNLLFTLVIVFGVSSNAQIMSFCDKTAQAEARAAFSVDFPGEVIIAVDSTATHYVSWHTKMYTANVASAQGITTYKVQIFEYETESTPCEVDSVTRQ